MSLANQKQNPRYELDDQGLTIVEVLAAFLVLIIATLALVGVYVTGYRLTHDSANSLAAYQVAKYDLDSLKAYEQYNWTWPAQLPAQFTTSAPTMVVNNVSYKTLYQYVSCPSGSFSLMIEVYVKVTWNDSTGSHAYSLASGIAAPQGVLRCP